jgi:RNA polymerase sigma-70 factor (ECF subfamily)
MHETALLIRVLSEGGKTLNKTFAGKSIQNIVIDYSDMLIRIAFQNTGSRANAEDLVQDVYIKLLKCKKEFENQEHVKAWLIRVLVNRCRDYHRSAWLRKVVPMHPEMDFLAPEEQEVMEEIFLLKPEERNIVYLFHYEGYTIKEIARMVNLKENTVSSKLVRARKKLKAYLMEGEMEA